ncbi:hypothetical protein KI387_032335, partial [Taxus chinensis]
PDLEVRFDVEEPEELQLECTYMEKDKGKLVYVINGKEVENLDANHTMGTRKVMDIVDEKLHAYYEPLKMKKVNIGLATEPKEVLSGITGQKK